MESSNDHEEFDVLTKTDSLKRRKRNDKPVKILAPDKELLKSQAEND